MLKILFWNISQGLASRFLGDVCFENNVDLLIVAEGEGATGVEELLNSFNEEPRYHEYKPVQARVRFFIKRSISDFRMVADGERYSIRGVTSSSGKQILITGAHLPSKLYATTEDQYYHARDMRRRIDEAERLNGHSNSILIGDLNMNPFEVGLVAHDGLHSCGIKAVALKRGRTYGGAFAQFFYNPMWKFFGDHTMGPPGTYYYSKSGLVNYYWNIFDQVLIKPDLIPALEDGGIQIVTSAGSTPLLKAGRPDSTISDHLPILVNLEL